MALVSVGLALLMTASRADTITCVVNGCEDQTINCTNFATDDCFITCAEAGCTGATINCLDGHVCHIEVNGLNSARQAIIRGNAASRLEIVSGSTGDKQLEEAS